MKDNNIEPDGESRLTGSSEPADVDGAADGPSGDGERQPLLSRGGQAMSGTTPGCWKTLWSCLCCCCGAGEEESESSEESGPDQPREEQQPGRQEGPQDRKQGYINLHNGRAYDMASDGQCRILHLCGLGSFGGLSEHEVNKLPPHCVDIPPSWYQAREMRDNGWIPPRKEDFPQFDGTGGARSSHECGDYNPWWREGSGVVKASCEFVD